MGNKVKEARKAAGLTQAETAQRAGVTERHYQDIEAGKYTTNVYTAIRIAHAVNSTVEGLFPIQNDSTQAR